MFKQPSRNSSVRLQKVDVNVYKKEYKYMAIPKSIPLRHKREAGDIQLQHLWKNIASFIVWRSGYT